MDEIVSQMAKICEALSTRVKYIQALRNHSRPGGTENAEAVFDGGLALSNMWALYNSTCAALEWKPVAFQLQAWIQSLLNEPGPVRLEPLPSGIRLEFTRGERPLTLNLDDLGTGVAEMLMLLFALHYWQRSGMAMTVLLEEPEAHLHPAAAAEFMRLVVKHLPRHQLLVTTHSTALVDAADSDWRMFRLDLSSGRTRVAPLSHSSDRRGLLADLGIRPSQLFLANAIVWVEGPSDCVYLRRLLSETCGADSLPPLVEGRDYAFAIYGGSAGVAHMSLGEDTERLVSLFFLSPNPIVICDRDVAFGEQLKVHVRRLLAEGQSLPGGPPVVVTHGREIENLVRPEILLDAVRACAPKSLGGKALRYPSVAIHDGDAFDVVVAGTARFEPDERLSAKERRVLAGRISANKGNIATHVVLASAPFNAGGTAFAREIIELIKRGRPL